MTRKKKSKITPLMQQFFEIKAQYPETLLLFQVGDFYELFFQDAQDAAAYLGIALTKRGTHEGNPIPLCGVPVHALDYYLVKLVKGGFRVALCDQLEEAQAGKLVRRGVTQVLTPGTLTDSRLLDEKSASYLFSFFPMRDSWGLLFGELMTAQLFATVLPAASERKLETELARFFPDEIVLPHQVIAKPFAPYFKKQGYVTTFDHLDFDDPMMIDPIKHWLQGRFTQTQLENLEHNPALRNALYLFHSYMRKNQEASLEQFRSINFYEPDDFLLLDPATQRNLELVKNNQDGSRKHSLFWAIDRASTPMGSRMIKKWLLRPLVKKEAITARHDALDTFIAAISTTQRLQHILNNIGDVERVIGRVALGRGTLNDYLMINQALDLLPELNNVLNTHLDVVLIRAIVQRLGDFSALAQLLRASLNDDRAHDWMIKQGFDEQLDQLRELVEHGNQKVLDLEKEEQEKTGINSLKIRYNNVHGYYIEVTKSNLHAVPDYYQRQQTLVNRERFVTKELQSLQASLFKARNEITQVEKEVFERIKREVAQHISGLRKVAHALAHLDALIGLAEYAAHNNYVRPTFNNERNILIKDGRHPVVELVSKESFIPNDTRLTDDESLWIITGPNMGGKSTYLRQVALTSILAQMGSFVPAQQADLPILDRIFTRIGAGDNVADGKSTFLVEMEETAAICTQATHKSLVILDEVGRGTSTFDGLAIAQAVVEYIYTQVNARCLFATHYHELTLLSDRFPGIASYYAASKKTTQGIVFLYKIVKGIADGSFGVEVAKLANLPAQVIARAQLLLQTLEAQEQHHSRAVQSTDENPLAAGYEQLMQENANLRETLLAAQEDLVALQEKLKLFKELDYDNLSPKKAFDLLWELKR